MRFVSLNRRQIVAGGIINIMTVLMLFVVLWSVPSIHMRTYATNTGMHLTVQNADIGTPKHLNIASIGMSLPVHEGNYDLTTGTWALSDTSAMHATNSVPLNDSNGTTLIYGHGTTAIFAHLSSLQKGDEAKVMATNGGTYVYKYVSKKDVDPTDTSIFNADGPPTLVLQTCSGPWDSKRSLYTFHLVMVRHEHTVG